MTFPNTPGALHGHSRFDHREAETESGGHSHQHDPNKGKGQRGQSGQHHHMHLYGRTKRVLKQIVLRDQIGRNYTFYVFRDAEMEEAEGILDQIREYLTLATRSRRTVHLTLKYDTSWYDEYLVYTG